MKISCKISKKYSFCLRVHGNVNRASKNFNHCTRKQNIIVEPFRQTMEKIHQNTSVLP